MQQGQYYLATPRDCSTSLQRPPPPIWSTLGGQPRFSLLELIESPGMMGRWATGHLERWWWTEGIASVRVRQTTRQNPQISHWTEFLLALPSLQGVRKVSILHPLPCKWWIPPTVLLHSAAPSSSRLAPLISCPPSLTFSFTPRAISLPQPTLKLTKGLKGIADLIRKR